MMDKVLLVRNLRGNWSYRLLNEFMHRNLNLFEFNFIDLSKKEYFPPFKRAPIFFGSRLRELVKSYFFYRNATAVIIRANILKSAKIKWYSILKISDLIVIYQLFTRSDSQEVTTFHKSGIPFGKFIHTTLIAKYGVKHFSMGFFKRLDNLLLFYRFMIGYRTHNNLILKNNYSKIVLINGRDAVGVGAQLAAYLNEIDIVCLENSINNSKIPLYSEWTGNMHHWMVRQSAYKKCLSINEDSFTLDDSKKILKEKFGLNSRHWQISKHKSSYNTFDLNKLKQKQFIVFFTTTEKESTTCPQGVKNHNVFDTFDQTEALKNVYQAGSLLGLSLVIRIHPNFSENTYAKNEMNYFLNLSKNWKDTVVIANNDLANSYELSKKALANFTFRSSISAELSIQGINCYATAPTGWNYMSNEEIKYNVDDILDVIINNKNSQINERNYYALGCYYANFSSKFKAIKFKLDDKGAIFCTKDTTFLDMPRFHFVKYRN